MAYRIQQSMQRRPGTFANRVVERMYSIPQKSGSELFHLRTLLTVVKGATSFEDLGRFNGTTYPTF